LRRHKRGLGGGEVRGQSFWEAVALFEPGWIVPEDDGVAGLGFGDEDLEREVERGAWCCDHERRSGFGVAEDQQFGRAHGEAGGDGFAGLVDEAEEFDALLL
jgi:hypothetical protein